MAISSAFGQGNGQGLFLALFLSDNKVHAALWQVSDDGIQILERSGIKSYTDPEKLLLATDQALQELGPESEKTNEVTFCVASNWANSVGIVDEKKVLLKKISTELSLKAVGFVVNTEVIARYIHSEEEVQNFVLLSVLDASIEVAISDQGNIKFREIVGRSADVVADITEAFARIEKRQHPGTYPAKIIIFSTELSDAETSKIQQAVIKQNWRESHSFVQIPVVDVVKNNVVLQQIIMQGGRAVAQAKGLLPEANAKLTAGAVSSTAQTAHFSSRMPQMSMPNMSTLSKNFGKGASAVFGKNKRQFSFAKVLHLLDGEMAHHKFIILGFLAGLLALALIAFIGLSNFSRIEIAIAPKRITVSKDLRIKLDPTADQSDPTSNTLAVRVVEKSQSGSHTNASTGIKLIGDPATGTVEILNKTDTEREFAAGTKLSSNNRVFTLDTAVNVASATVSATQDGETRSYGKAEAKVTATDIGAEGNISSGTDLQIADFASGSYSARAIENFNGGSSREIQVVSKKDQDEALQDLQDELVQQALQAFKDESSASQYFLPSGTVTVESKNYSAAVGDEVNTFTLDLSVSIEAYAYDSQDITPLAEASLGSELPEGYQLIGEPQILSSPEESKSDSTISSLEANISSAAQHSFSVDELLASIAGKRIAEAQTELEANETIDSVDFVFRPSVAHFFLHRIPKKADRVTFIIPEE